MAAAAENLNNENSICKLFCLESFRDFQICALRDLFRSKDVIVCQPTGSGKSLVFLSLPFLFGTFFEEESSNIFVHGKKESVFVSTQKSVLVISPLESLILDQMKKLKSLGINSIKADCNTTKEVTVLRINICNNKLIYIYLHIIILILS